VYFRENRPKLPGSRSIYVSDRALIQNPGYTYRESRKAAHALELPRVNLGTES